MMTGLFVVIVVFLVEIHARTLVKRGGGNTVLDNRGGLKKSVLNNKDLSATDKIMYINEVEDVDYELEEGDIIREQGTNDAGKKEKRNAVRSRSKVWRTKVVPYEISSELVQGGYNETIQAAITAFHNNTCIRWEPHENEKYWVMFIKGKGCYADLGFSGKGKQPRKISLGDGCNTKDTALHEMMHTLGFRHEHVRPDRDNYVEIFWENIQPGKEHNFAKKGLEITDPLEASYSFESIMHYGRLAYSSNGRHTIEVVGNPDQKLGQTEGLSQTDIEQLNALYDCSNPETHGWSVWSNYGPCDDECFHTRERFCSHEDLSNCPGADKYGVEIQKTKCPLEKCYAPVNGHWGRWSSWSACSVSCDFGTHTRTRQCDDPTPKNGGNDCVGKSKDAGKCTLSDCNLGPHDVSFEREGMHGWQFCDLREDKERPNWFLKLGSTSTRWTGPDRDHTSGSGHYIYFESTPGNEGDSACFHSPEIPATSCTRLTFWYHMKGVFMGSLKVWLKSSDGSANKTVWERSCQQGLDWLPASVDISSKTHFQIYFEGVRGIGHEGDIGIDDVKFMNCTVSPSAPSSRIQGSPDVCFSNPIGVSDPAIIPDSRITASSEYNTCFKPAFGRLDGHRGDGWCSKFSRSNREWLQVDLGDTFKVCGVGSQGDVDGNEYVAAFKLSFSFDRFIWSKVRNIDGSEKIFQRNSSSETTDQHELSSPVFTRYVRFHPTAREKWNCLRVEVYGTVE